MQKSVLSLLLLLATVGLGRNNWAAERPASVRRAVARHVVLPKIHVQELALGQVIEHKLPAHDLNWQEFNLPTLVDSAIVSLYLEHAASGERRLVLGHYLEDELASHYRNLGAINNPRAACAAIEAKNLVIIARGSYRPDPDDPDNHDLMVSPRVRTIIDHLSMVAGVEPYVALQVSSKPTYDLREDFKLRFSSKAVRWSARSEGYLVRYLAGTPDSR